MTNKIKRSIRTAAESDYEIHRLAKVWGVTVTAARERCYRFAGSLSGRKVAAVRIKETADMRQAEAKVEMLKADR